MRRWLGVLRATESGGDKGARGREIEMGEPE